MATAFGPDDADRLSAVANTAIEEFRLPGLAVGVVSGDRLAWAEGFGLADIETRQPMLPGLRQRIGSITKTMVGLSAMALVDEGRLALSDRLAQRIPELTLHGHGVDATVRHLLTHTAGIGEAAMPDEPRDPEAALLSRRDAKDVLGLFPNGLTIEVPPGTKWSYANLGYALLGEIVARIEGAPIAEVIRRRVFEPLGMADTDLLDRPHPDLSTSYHRPPGEDERALSERAGLAIPDEPTVDGVNIRGAFVHLGAAGAAGSVQSTVPDMARYAAALLRDGGGIVRPETFRAMIGPQWEPDDRLESWGLSFQRFVRFGQRLFGHGGGLPGGWNTMLLVDPEGARALIIHANLYAPQVFEAVESRLLAAFLGASAPKLGGTVSDAVLLSAPGVYEALPGALTNVRVSGMMGRLQIKAEGGGLVLHARRGPWKNGVNMHPDPSDPAFFHLADSELEPSGLVLVRDADGHVTGLRCGGLVEMRRADHVAPWA